MPASPRGHPPRCGPSPPARKGLVPHLAPAGPPMGGGIGDPDSALFLKFFVCYSLRIKVCGSGLPPGGMALQDLPWGDRHPPPQALPSPPQQAAAPVGVALFINRHEHTAGTELVLSKNSYRKGAGGERGQAGAKRGWEGGVPARKEGAGEGKSPTPGPHRGLGGGGCRQPQPCLGWVTLLPYSFIIIIIIPFFFF